MKSLPAILFAFLLSFNVFAQNADEKVQDTLQADTTEVVEADSAHSQKPGKGEEVLADTLEHYADEAKDVAMDTLKNKLNTGDIGLDSTLVDKARSTAKQAAKDSLDNYVDVPDITIDSTTTDQVKREVKSRSKSALEDELDTDIPDVTIDSTTTDQLKRETKSRSKAALEDELGTDIPDITIDSTTTQQVKDEASKRAESAVKSTDQYKSINDIPKDSELGQLDDYKGKLEKTQEEIKQAAAKQELKEKMTSSARQYITENSEKISQVQSKMGELKKKYSYMPNSNDLSSAVKRTSLKEESFWKRLVLGGNFNVSKTNPLNIDLSPVVGYKINKLFEVGITGAYRTQFKADRNGVNGQGQEVYGYSVFANHMAFKSFFAHLEGERMRTTNLNSEDLKREWTQTLLIGVGRKMNIAKWLEMQAMVLFNVLHDNKDGLYNSPVVFKTGFRIRK